MNSGAPTPKHRCILVEALHHPTEASHRTLSPPPSRKRTAQSRDQETGRPRGRVRARTGSAPTPYQAEAEEGRCIS